MTRRLATMEAIGAMTDGQVARLDSDYWSLVAASCEKHLADLEKHYRPLMGGQAPEAIDSGIGFFRNRSTRYNGQSGVMFEASARPKRLGSASRQGDNKMPPRDGTSAATD